MLNKALDTGEGKPPELNIKYWEELKTIRESEESKRKSVQMGNQARNRGLRNSTKEKIRQAAAVKLVSHTTQILRLEKKHCFLYSILILCCHLCK
jgi:hypothetical protein